MQELNIVYKQELRKKTLKYRRNITISDKVRYDDNIFKNIITLDEFSKYNFICTYVSTDIEVDTQRLIKFSLKEGKKIAVPKCIKGKNEMDFYFITSFNDLEPGSFSVLEPKNTCKKVTDFKNALFIIPGLCYDKQGYRVGYGKGYYDRFLSENIITNSCKIGITYNANLLEKLYHEKHDLPVNILVTDENIIYIGGQNGKK